MADRRSGSRINPDNIPVSEYLVVKTSALPEVFSNVMKVKYLLQSGDVNSVNEAVKIIGMSRSAFYKYRDDIQSFQDPIEAELITIVASLLIDSEALSTLILNINEEGGKILNIAQGLPRHGFVDLMLSVDFTDSFSDLTALRRQLARVPGVRKVDLWSQEDE